MKRPSPSHKPPKSARRSVRKAAGSVGKWAFNLASETLFALGSTESSRRVAYRTADGQVRFLPR